MAPPLSPSSQFLIIFIKIYQYLISPLIGPRCRFIPTCSNYGIKVIYRFGVIKGSWLIIKRILKCHHLHLVGNDQSPGPLDTGEH